MEIMGFKPKRRLYSTTFVAIAVTLYITALILIFMPVEETEINADDFDRFERSMLTRSQDNKRREIAHQNIQAFESSYVRVKARKADKEMYEDSGEDMKTLKKKLFQKYSFNELESSKVGLERKIPDNRPQKCFALQYPIILPTASVIIIFHNEAWSTLLRTIHSVLSRSPPAFLKQIILVDDCSDTEHGFEHLGTRLDEYLQSLPKIHLLRSPRRQGIVAARLRGASLAEGDVLVFLDSHCEASNGWLEPLLARIAEDKRHIVTPDIEVIDFDTFEYAERRDPSIGVFNWEMLFKWRKMNAFEKTKEAQGLPLRFVNTQMRTLVHNYVHVECISQLDWPKRSYYTTIYAVVCTTCRDYLRLLFETKL